MEKFILHHKKGESVTICRLCGYFGIERDAYVVEGVDLHVCEYCINKDISDRRPLQFGVPDDRFEPPSLVGMVVTQLPDGGLSTKNHGKYNDILFRINYRF